MWSGFTPAGYPKVVPIALADHVEKNNLQGKMKFNLFIGASVGAETEDRWATLDMIDRRWPYQTGKNIAAGINEGRIRMGDKHLGLFAQDISYGFYTENGRYDIGIIEVSAITEDCGLALTTSCGIVAEAINLCDKIIIEVNTGQPSFEGMHDIHMQQKPPHRAAVPDHRGRHPHRHPLRPLRSGQDRRHRRVEAPRQGSCLHRAWTTPRKRSPATSSSSSPTKIKMRPSAGEPAAAAVGRRFHRQRRCRRPGQGSVLQPVGLHRGSAGHHARPLRRRQPALRLLLLAVAVGRPRASRASSTTGRSISSKITLRPLSISNAPEPIRRLGCIAMNTPVEIDIYAHANSTLVGGTRMINGLGGSGDFLRNGYLKIMHTPSTRPSKTDPNGITCVVPQAAAHRPHRARPRRAWSPSRAWPTSAASARRTAPEDHREVRPSGVQADPHRLLRNGQERDPGQGDRP